MKKKLHLIARDPVGLPKLFWQQTLSELAEWEIIELPLDLQSLKPLWKDLLQESDAMIFDRSDSSDILQLLRGVPRAIGEVQCIDALVKDKSNNWWPECFFRDVMHREIIGAAHNLDTSASAYITGEGSLMRVGVSVLVQIGYRQINLILERPEEFDFLSDVFKRMYFDTEISIMKNTDLTLQKNDGTILINTVKLSEHVELKDDLTYLNFIFGAGLVVDMQGDQLSNPVLDEATHVGLRVLNGFRLQAVADWQVLTKILGPLAVSQDEFVQKWKEYVQQKIANENPDIGPVTKEGG